MKIPNNLKTRVQKLAPTIDNVKLEHFAISDTTMTGVKDKKGYNCLQVYTDRIVNTFIENLEDINLNGLNHKTNFVFVILNENDFLKLTSLVFEYFTKTLKEEVNIIVDDKALQVH